jgi:cytochrome c oxidase subunit 2
MVTTPQWAARARKVLMTAFSDRTWRATVVAATAVAGAAAMGWTLAGAPTAPEDRTFHVRARSFAFEPAVLRVRQGDRVTLHLAAEDVVHGFFLEGHGIDATLFPLRREFDLRVAGKREKANAVTFTADRAGKYRYRCSVSCGAMHAFMSGELIVEPNRLWPSAAAAAVGLSLVAVLVLGRKARGREVA